jgi:penicillin G amidase
MRKITSIVSAVALAAALFVGALPVGPVPPLGGFLNPASGIWSVARAAELPAEQSVTLSGFSADVEVKYDDRGVPHIFASTEADAARALGWVHARDRLFQMELIQRAVAGTLTELVGARALPLDQNARRMMMGASADAKWNALPDTSSTRTVVTAYMEGLNAYVSSMRPQDLPLEYRLLNAKPRVFEPKDTYYLLMRMSQTLSYQEAELRFAALEQLIGREAASALLPTEAPIQEPIEPVPGRIAAREVPTTIPAPIAPDARRVAEAKRIRDAVVQIAQQTAMPLNARDPLNADLTDLLTRGEAVVGSNNWAVSPGRSASGFAMLAGDPHLELTLPSIWYEAHLVVPGVMDVYGVSLPLSPIIPIGFNRDVAWTMTNTGNDVVDYYKEQVDDSLSPRKYRVDGEWRDVTLREEVFHDAKGNVISRDTMFATHRGPLMQTSLGWLSQRWTAREVSDEGGVFRLGMRATSSADFYARTAEFKTPAQNMLTADRQGNIGIRSTGRYPIRPEGRGDLVQDGTLSAYDWSGNQPLMWYPQAYNPAQGYLASANQQPIDPQARNQYHGSDWPSPWRAMRINNILRANPQMTVDDMRRAHTDPRSELTPYIMAAANEAKAAAEAAGTWSADDAAAYEVLTQWNGEFTPNSSGAPLFMAFVTEITAGAWDELVLPGENRRVATPQQLMLITLMRDNSNAWWDVRATPERVENRDAVVHEALRRAWTTTRGRLGNEPSAWQWSAMRTINVHHLLKLPGFGRESLAVTSGPGTLSPAESGGTHGASWRFVVELAPQIRAWGTYPGGQSGNPVSSRYADRIAMWQAGELAELRVPLAAADLTPEHTTARVVFTSNGGAR